jgi:hypothetical protein
MDLGIISSMDWFRVLVSYYISCFGGIPWNEKIMEELLKKWENKQENLAYFIQDLDECFEFLQSRVVDYKSFIREEEKTATIRAHHGLGRWLRNTLGLWADLVKDPEERSPLAKWFNERGIFHPDDMSSIILTSWHRHLNNKDIELKKQIKRYRGHWLNVDPKVNQGMI